MRTIAAILALATLAGCPLRPKPTPRPSPDRAEMLLPADAVPTAGRHRLMASLSLIPTPAPVLAAPDTHARPAAECAALDVGQTVTGSLAAGLAALAGAGSILLAGLEAPPGAVRLGVGIAAGVAGALAAAAKAVDAVLLQKYVKGCTLNTGGTP